jgi:hypothetical protein
MSKMKTIVLALAVGCAGLGGCAQVSPWMANNGWMSKDMMNSQGDMLIKDGNKLKADAANLKPGEWSVLHMRNKETMIADGDKMIADGNAMKSKAMSAR